jgi:hypothetical protein
VSALGVFYKDPAHLEDAPPTATRISAAEALRRAKARIDTARGEAAEPPIFVHDGPPGREAWLVTVVRDRRPDRWLFITGGGIYERPARTLLDQGLE